MLINYSSTQWAYTPKHPGRGISKPKRINSGSGVLRCLLLGVFGRYSSPTITPILNQRRTRTRKPLHLALRLAKRL